MRLRKLHSLLLRRRGETSHDFLLSDDSFRFAAECERMRVDRNGSVVSLLLIELPKQHSSDEDVAFLARVLEGRLRVTDTPGILRDGRIAILLPDTAAEGAWKVAVDISDIYPPGPERPECNVLVYPDKSQQHQHAEEDHEISKAPQSGDAESSSEFFFAQAMPRWKRSLDVVGSLVGLVASAPVMLVAVAAIKATSQGPVFFTQEREGIGGTRFQMWKLRTMCKDAESQKKDLLQHSHQDGPAFKLKNDPRTTSVGKVLRWTSIDELPQFFNVLKGDMSLVGPRPLPTIESVACENWHRRRLSVMPGMTCTWQVSERGSVKFDEWVRMDIRYAQKKSLLEDMKLLIWTLPSLLVNKGMR